MCLWWRYRVILRWGTWPWEMSVSCFVCFICMVTLSDYFLINPWCLSVTLWPLARSLLLKSNHFAADRKIFYKSLMHVSVCVHVCVCVSVCVQSMWQTRCVCVCRGVGRGESSVGWGGEVAGVGGVGESFSWPLSPLWTLFSSCDWLTPRHCHWDQTERTHTYLWEREREKKKK